MPPCPQMWLAAMLACTLIQIRPRVLFIPHRSWHPSKEAWAARRAPMQFALCTRCCQQSVYAPPSLSPIQLASFQGGVDGKTSPSAEATPLPPEQMRPPGPITLAGARSGRGCLIAVQSAVQSLQAYLCRPDLLRRKGARDEHLYNYDSCVLFCRHAPLQPPAGRLPGPLLPASSKRRLHPTALLCLPNAGVRHSYLWLADCLGRPFLVSLRHPGMRLRCLAARGEISTARTIAERGGYHRCCW